MPPESTEKEIENISVDNRLLPYAIETILIDSGILPQDAKFFTADASRSQVFLGINEIVKDPAFVAKALANNLKPEDYPKFTIAVLADIFALLKAEKITVVLLQQALKQLITNRTIKIL